MKKRIISFFIAVLIICTAVASFVSCSPPPELYEVKDRLVWLLENSYEINEVLFGDGLVSVYDLSGFDDKYESWFEGEDHYYYYSEIPSTYLTEDEELIEQYRGIDEIKSDAALVYSSSYMRKINQSIFVDDYEGGNRAKYFEIKSEESGETVFVKYNFAVSYINDENPATVYDYDTMEIVVPSSGETLIVEIQGYNEKYFDPKTGTVGSGWHTVTLQFILEDGQWFLDGPSY